jgi:hypothetical protein
LIYKTSAPDSCKYAENAIRWARRNHALVAVVAAALAVVAAIAATSVSRITRERDVTAAHRDSAEKLVDGILSQLVSRLERDGRLDLLAGATASVDEYYTAVRGSRLASGAGADRRHADVLTLRGEAAYLKSDLDEARRGFAAASEIVAGLEPIGDEETLRTAARAHLGLSRLGGRRGTDDQGRHHERALAFSERLVAATPRSPRAWALWGEIRLHAVPGRRSDYRLVRDRLAPLAAELGDRRLGLVFALAELRVAGQALDGGNQLDSDEALARAVTAHEAQTRRFPEETRGWEQLAWTYLVDARRARQVGRDEVSLRRAEAARAIQQRLLVAEPDHVERQRGVAAAQRVVCLSARRLAHLEIARAACASSVALTAPLHHAEPESAQVLWDHISGLGLSADVELAAGRLEAARALIDEALRVQGARRGTVYPCTNLLIRARIERAPAAYREARACYEDLMRAGAASFEIKTQHEEAVAGQ